MTTRPARPTASAGSELRHTLLADNLELPAPGSGRTAQRHHALVEWGRRDLSVARLVEAHVDALAILAEAGRSPRPGRLYGVWASDRPGSGLSLYRTGGRYVLAGTKAFCTGLGICDAALVTVRSPDGPAPLLLDLDLDHLDSLGATTAETDAWATTAFAGTRTGTLHISEAPIDEQCSLGPPGWYLQRPGFWHGAIGPAAVWAGGTIALADAALVHLPDDPHARAHAGALRATAWNLDAILDAAAVEIDADPIDHQRQAEGRALTVRHLVERAATETVDRFGRAVGPGPLAFDAAIARRKEELLLYIRQNHAERDLERLHLCTKDRPLLTSAANGLP